MSPTSDPMKLLYCSDLHGDEGHYDRLIALAGDRRPDVVVLGGDMLPDDSALEPARMGRGQPEFVRRRFREIITAIRAACDCEAVLVIYGNHDWSSSVPAMEELAHDGLLSILEHTKALAIRGLSFLGYSFSPPTPWFVKDFERLDQTGDAPPLLGGARWDARFSRATAHGAPALFKDRETISEQLAALAVPSGPWVFVAHAPPYGTKLDQSIQQEPWGSRAICEALEKHQPLLSLHGHIHDSPRISGAFRHDIGKTVAINAGQTRTRLNYAWIEIDIPGRKVKDAQHGQQS